LKNQLIFTNPEAYVHALCPHQFINIVAEGHITIHGKETCKFFFIVAKNGALRVYFLEDSILVLWNQETLLDSWTGISLVQVHLIQLGLLNVFFFMNLVVHILYNDPLIHIHLCIILRMP
jgi:hypothetical protein